jgi:penicillin-binding protein 1A
LGRRGHHRLVADRGRDGDRARGANWPTGGRQDRHDVEQQGRLVPRLFERPDHRRRDDARAVGGLQGGRAPAKAFADYMRIAVARRPVEPFDTEVKLPEWQLEGDDEAYFGAPEENGGMVDENGMPIELPAAPDTAQGDVAPPPPADGPVLNQQWIEEQTGRRPPADNGAAAPKAAPPAPPKAPPPVLKAPPARAPANGEGN